MKKSVILIDTQDPPLTIICPSWMILTDQPKPTPIAHFTHPSPSSTVREHSPSYRSLHTPRWTLLLRFSFPTLLFSFPHALFPEWERMVSLTITYILPSILTTPKTPLYIVPLLFSVSFVYSLTPQNFKAIPFSISFSQQYCMGCHLCFHWWHHNPLSIRLLCLHLQTPMCLPLSSLCPRPIIHWLFL